MFIKGRGWDTVDIITVDFESYYDSTFSLSKITTEEYIRDPRFEVIGVAVKVNDGNTEWFSGTMAQTKAWLGKFDWDNSAAIAHNAMFDMAILNWHFDIRPKRIIDTLSMGRALHGSYGISLSLKSLSEYYGLGVKGTEVIAALGKGRLDFTRADLARYGDYCVNDVELTYALFDAMMHDFPVVELRLIDLTIRMFTEPVLVLDASTLQQHLWDVQATKEDLLSKAIVDKGDIMSNPKLAKILRDAGVEPPMKISPTTGKEAYAFAKSDEEFKALLEHENIAIQSIVAARLGVKSTLEETRTQRMLDVASRGTLPIPLRYYAAHTGRWGGSDRLNMQNLPRKSVLKKAMLAPDGYMFIDCDSSQIEARTLAWLAGQDDLVEAFDRGEDVYKIMASSIYDKPVDKITDDERFVGKTTILGCGYGMGAKKFQAQLLNFGVTTDLQECTRIINVYRETYYKIPLFWAQAGRVLEAMIRGNSAALGPDNVVELGSEPNTIRLPNRLHLHYPNLRKTETNGKVEMVYDTKKGKSITPNRIYGGKLTENICQALARIIIGEQMLMIARRFKVAMTVHDAVGCVVPSDEAVLGREFIETCMRIRPKWAWALPLNCESKVGVSYGG